MAETRRATARATRARPRRGGPVRAAAREASSALDTPGNLPVRLSTFVGREPELAGLRAALAGTRLLTLLGAGGCGKTSLALRLAAEALPRFPGGAWWIEFGPLSDPALLAPAVATALGVRPLPGQSDLDAAISALAGRRAVVVLDNCEHLLEEAARVAEALARRCPLVTVIATSRAPLGVTGETHWRVPPLSLPAEDGDASADAAGRGDAVRLFVERARSVRPDFALGDANAAAVTRICRELDGIPLAIELAAARVGALSVGQIAEALSDRFRLLTDGPRGSPPQQRTLRASVEWSHDLLTDVERAVFRRAGVFAGTFTLEAAEPVCAGERVVSADVLTTVASLVAKSLLQADERGRVARYRMLETVRRYALERLEEAGETRRVAARHADAFLALAERSAPELLTPRQPAVLAELDAEEANLVQAVEWGATSDPDTALRLCIALAARWRLRALFTQGTAAFRRALAAAPEPSGARARALWGHAYLLAFAGDFAEAERHARSALAEAERLGDDLTAGRALTILGKCELMRERPPVCRERLARARVLADRCADELSLMHLVHALAFSHLFQEDHERARHLFEDVLPVVERTGYGEFVANHWGAVGWMHYVSGDLPAARAALQRALAAARAIGDTVTEAGVSAYAACADTDAGRPARALEALVPIHGRALARGAGFLLPWAEVAIAEALAADGDLEGARAAFTALIDGPAGDIAYAHTWALVGLAETLRHLGDVDGAEDAARRGLDRAEWLGNPWFAARARLVLGRIRATQGRWSQAEHLHQQALETIAARGYGIGLPTALEALAEVAEGFGSPVEAARILGAARRVRQERGLVPWAPSRHQLDALARRLRSGLGEEPFERAAAEGMALAPQEAVAWLRRARGERRRPSVGWESLTPTEAAVVRYVAAGLTNPEIAARMFIARSTVKAHLAHVYGKLGVRGRLELIREASTRS